jgi:hypothetical protein
MGNSESRMATSFAITVGSMVAAPFTGGVSLVVGLGAVSTRNIMESHISENYTRETKIRNAIPPKLDLGSQIKFIEIRYCHISGPITDFSSTLAARSFGMTTKAAHHHFIIIELESGQIIYTDKHYDINLIQRNNRQGKAGNGEWIDSECLKSKQVSNTNLLEVVQHIKENSSKRYHLLDDNCQDFAEFVYDFVQ